MALTQQQPRPAGAADVVVAVALTQQQRPRAVVADVVVAVVQPRLEAVVELARRQDAPVLPAPAFQPGAVAVNHASGIAASRCRTAPR